MKNKAAEEMDTYVALLRGINVGGHKYAPMAEVRKAFVKMGFHNVGSILATGNIIFDAPSAKVEKLSEMITTFLEQTFGFEIPVVLVTLSSIKKIAESNSFENVDVTSSTRLYVSFFSEKNKSKLKIPYTSTDGSFEILSVKDNAIFSVLDLDKTQTPDVMNILEKEYGKKITTRNWNTVQKIAKA